MLSVSAWLTVSLGRRNGIADSQLLVPGPNLSQTAGAPWCPAGSARCLPNWMTPPGKQHLGSLAFLSHEAEEVDVPVRHQRVCLLCELPAHSPDSEMAGGVASVTPSKRTDSGCEHLTGG